MKCVRTYEKKLDKPDYIQRYHMGKPRKQKHQVQIITPVSHCKLLPWQETRDIKKKKKERKWLLNLGDVTYVE
jgi:hypothetical protein